MTNRIQFSRRHRIAKALAGLLILAAFMFLIDVTTHLFASGDISMDSNHGKEPLTLLPDAYGIYSGYAGVVSTTGTEQPDAVVLETEISQGTRSYGLSESQNSGESRVEPEQALTGQRSETQVMLPFASNEANSDAISEHIASTERQIYSASPVHGTWSPSIGAPLDGSPHNGGVVADQPTGPSPASPPYVETGDGTTGAIDHVTNPDLNTNGDSYPTTDIGVISDQPSGNHGDQPPASPSTLYPEASVPDGNLTFALLLIGISALTGFKRLMQAQARAD